MIPASEGSPTRTPKEVDAASISAHWAGCPSVLYHELMSSLTPSERASCERLIELALAEDLAELGDVTSRCLIPLNQKGKAQFVARVSGVIAGLPVVEAVARQIDPELQVELLLSDGARVPGHTGLAIISGRLRSLLTVERTALNFLQRLSGIASLTRRYVDAITGLPTKVLDTRKTTPGWRLLEKYAVRMGGGTNHRIGLYDGVLVKDNHLAGLGDPGTAIITAVERIRSDMATMGLIVEVEVDTLDQLEQALPLNLDVILLDNMAPPQLKQAVSRRNAVSPGTRLEASGGVNLTTIRAIAETGVDRISVGALTHSATALDIALDYLD